MKIITNMEEATNNIKKPRTDKQNRSLHLYFTLLADTLNEAGLDQRVVLKPSILIDWTARDVKERLWRPIQEAYIKERSTTKLTTKDLDKIWDFLNRHLSEKFGVFVDFPHFPNQEDFLNTKNPLPSKRGNNIK